MRDKAVHLYDSELQKVLRLMEYVLLRTGAETVAESRAQRRKGQGCRIRRTYFMLRCASLQSVLLFAFHARLICTCSCCFAFMCRRKTHFASTIVPIFRFHDGVDRLLENFKQAFSRRSVLSGPCQVALTPWRGGAALAPGTTNTVTCQAIGHQ